jgi:hypothetical protein
VESHVDGSTLVIEAKDLDPGERIFANTGK